MSGPRDSILKRWHAWTVRPGHCNRLLSGTYWTEVGDFRDVECRLCRKFNPVKSACSVGFGTPLRKCSIASIEAHLHDTSGEEVLEIGYGRLATARNLIRRAGGRWTGIDPGQPTENGARLGQGGYGHAAEIPFPNETFDLVFGIQTFEHWGQKANARKEPSEYPECLNEVLRVMKPGARLYLDAPMHFHGHEWFIMADIDRIRALFKNHLWQDVVIERWRRDFAPLQAYPPSEKVQQEWPLEITSYSEREIDRVRQASVWLLTITARKVQ